MENNSFKNKEVKNFNNPLMVVIKNQTSSSPLNEMVKQTQTIKFFSTEQLKEISAKLALETTLNTYNHYSNVELFNNKENGFFEFYQSYLKNHNDDVAVILKTNFNLIYKELKKVANLDERNL